jgi:hypothetical protein
LKRQVVIRRAGQIVIHRRYLDHPMPIKRRVYVSLPADPHLPKNLNALKWGIVAEIERHGFVPEIFTNPTGRQGLASARSWHPRDADEIARRCVGAAVLGIARWKFKDADGDVLLPTEFNHYEGALARTLGLPTLVLVQWEIKRRVVFDLNFAGFVGGFDAKADVNWLKTTDFKVPFGYWLEKLRDRRDVFFGYAGASSPTADAIKTYLTKSLGASVLDWQTDFIPGRTILNQIEQAAARSIGGIFLFTKDDEIVKTSSSRRRPSRTTSGAMAVPRDNVVFEAGYFIGLKGKNNVLIIREAGSKLPADLGGDIYAPLPNRNDINTIKPVLKAFVDAI